MADNDDSLPNEHSDSPSVSSKEDDGILDGQIFSRDIEEEVKKFKDKHSGIDEDDLSRAVDVFRQFMVIGKQQVAHLNTLQSLKAMTDENIPMVLENAAFSARFREFVGSKRSILATLHKEIRDFAAVIPKRDSNAIATCNARRQQCVNKLQESIAMVNGKIEIAEQEKVDIALKTTVLEQQIDDKNKLLDLKKLQNKELHQVIAQLKSSINDLTVEITELERKQFEEAQKRRADEEERKRRQAEEERKLREAEEERKRKQLEEERKFIEAEEERKLREAEEERKRKQMEEERKFKQAEEERKLREAEEERKRKQLEKELKLKEAEEERKLREAEEERKQLEQERKLKEAEEERKRKQLERERKKEAKEKRKLRDSEAKRKREQVSEDEEWLQDVKPKRLSRGEKKRKDEEERQKRQQAEEEERMRELAEKLKLQQPKKALDDEDEGNTTNNQSFWDY